MRKFHSILIGNILRELKESGLSTLERSTLYRLEYRLGFNTQNRNEGGWRIYKVEEAAALKIAILNYYRKPLPEDLEIMYNDLAVKKLLEEAHKKAEEIKELENRKKEEKKLQHLVA